VVRSIHEQLFCLIYSSLHSLICSKHNTRGHSVERRLRPQRLRSSSRCANLNPITNRNFPNV